MNELNALARERAGYAATGRDDRVAQVDEQLKVRGYQVDKDGELVKIEAPKREKRPAAKASETRKG